MRNLILALMLAAGTFAATGALAVVTPQAPAPDFTLKTAEGRKLRLAEQRGQVVLVNFWASWCAPCKVEMPHLNALADKYRNTGVVLVGINVDDDPKKAAAEAQKLGIRFPVLLDTDKAASKAYRLEAMPTTVLVDRDGRVRHVHQGYRPGYEATYDAQIRALVKE